MDTKFEVFWHGFLIPFFDARGSCFVSLCLSSHHAMMSFLCYKHCVFVHFVDFAFCKINWRSEANHFKNRTHKNQQTDDKSYQNRLPNRSFLDLLDRCLTTSILNRFWIRFGFDFGTTSKLKIELKTIGQINKKTVANKSCGKPQAGPPTWEIGPGVL